MTHRNPAPTDGLA